MICCQLQHLYDTKQR